VADEILNITAKVVDAIKSERARRVALTTVLSQHKPRIFERGQAADGSQLGSYSPKYAKYRATIGRPSSFVNLQLTGQMMNDYGLVVSGQQYAFGFQNPANADKMGWMTDKYEREIAHLSEQELDLLADILTEELGR
jgi:hypothetical protein